MLKRSCRGSRGCAHAGLLPSRAVHPLPPEPPSPQLQNEGKSPSEWPKALPSRLEPSVALQYPSWNSHSQTTLFPAMFAHLPLAPAAVPPPPPQALTSQARGQQETLQQVRPPLCVLPPRVTADRARLRANPSTVWMAASPACVRIVQRGHERGQRFQEAAQRAAKSQ